MTPRNTFTLALAFFLSGFVTLAYETAFIKFFSPILGLGISSISAILCAFFGGAALGNYAACLLIGKFRNPLALFLMLELLAAGYLLALPTQRDAVVDVYLSVSNLIASENARHLIRFSVALIAMLLPALAVGISFPLFLAFLDAGQHKSIYRLYGLNLLGGAFGCFSTGFFLLPRFGVQKSILFAVAANLVTLSLILCNFWKRPDLVRAQARGRIRKSGDAMFFFIYFFLGLFTAILTFILFRILLIFIGGTVYSFSVLTTTALLSSAIGSFGAKRIYDAISRRKSGLDSLLHLLGLVAIFSMAPLYMLYFSDPGAVAAPMNDWLKTTGLSFLLALAFAVPVTLLIGASFYVINRSLDSRRDLYRANAVLFSVYGVGMILGTLLCPFVFLKFIGVQDTWLLAVFVLFVFVIILSAKKHGVAKMDPVLGAQGLVLIALLLALPRDILQKKYSEIFGKIVYYKESPGDIAFVYQVPNERQDVRLGFHDGRGTCATRKSENFVARMLAHTSMLMHPGAKDILIISFGCGNTASAFSKYPVTKIDIVDISPSVRDTAKFFWTNEGVLGDSRVRLYIDDGRNFLLHSEKRYDIIQIELPNLLSDGVVYLYTQEFYRIAREKLNPDGMISQWINSAKSGRDASLSLINTILTEFPNAALFGSHWALWVNAKNSGAQDLFPYNSDLTKNFSDEHVRRDLSAIGLDFEKIFSTLLAYGDRLSAAAMPYSVLTDDHTAVDYLVPRLYFENIFSGNLNRPLDLRAPNFIDEFPGIAPDEPALTRYPLKIRRKISYALSKKNI